MSELKALHPYLYKRVRLKGWLFTMLGLSSIFAAHIDRWVGAVRGNSTGLPSWLTGSVFLILGLGVLIGLYGKPNWYTTARKFLYGCAVYALFWEFVLIGLMFTKNISTVSIFLLWGYLTYNLILVARDSGWEGAEIVKEIQEKTDGSN